MALPTPATSDAYNVMNEIISFMVDNGLAAGNAMDDIAVAAQSDSVGGYIPLPSGISLARYDISDAACTITFVPRAAGGRGHARPWKCTAQA